MQKIMHWLECYDQYQSILIILFDIIITIAFEKVDASFSTPANSPDLYTGVFGKRKSSDNKGNTIIKRR